MLSTLLSVSVRSYNVDCHSAHLYFDLNSALYPSPETISNAIKPAIRLAQVSHVLVIHFAISIQSL